MQFVVRKPGNVAFGVWVAVLCVCMAVHAACSYPKHLNRVMRETEALQLAFDWCPQSSAIMAASPYSFAKMLVYIGPFPMWILLLIQLWNDRYLSYILLTPVATYLSFIFCVRFAHRLSSFDPSGYVPRHHPSRSYSWR
jgi:hypothetical protein